MAKNDQPPQGPATDDESITMRAAVMRKALSGDAGGALDMAMIHDLVAGDAEPDATNGDR